MLASSFGHIVLGSPSMVLITCLGGTTTIPSASFFNLVIAGKKSALSITVLMATKSGCPYNSPIVGRLREEVYYKFAPDFPSDNSINTNNFFRHPSLLLRGFRSWIFSFLKRILKASGLASRNCQRRIKWFPRCGDCSLG